MEVKGDMRIKRSLNVERRVNQGTISESISAQRNLVLDDYYWLRLSNSSTQDVVLPDATTLPLGWQVVVDVPTASVSSVNVKTYHLTVPVLLKNIQPSRAYEMTLVDNSTSAGVWHKNFLEEADLVPSLRYLHNFNNTTDWGTAVGGYYTITVSAVTHGMGINPVIVIKELTGSDFVTVDVDQILVLANGDTSIRVPETPNCRFAGRIVFN